MLDYRSDRAVRASARPYGSTTFIRWYVEADNLMLEYAPQNGLLSAASHALGRITTEAYPIRLLDNGEIEMELTQLDGSKRLQIMIPWTGAFADKIQQVE